MDVDKQLVQLTHQDLTNAGYVSDGTSNIVSQAFKILKNKPDLLAGLTLYMFQCQTVAAQHVISPPASPVSDTHTILSDITTSAEYYQVVAPNLISDFERFHFWHGVSYDPPELVWRSDLETNPFPVPAPGARFFKIAVKTAEGVINTPLNPVWETVTPLIVSLFKQRGIKYSALKAVRFSTCDDKGKKTLGPIALWIATHPGKCTPEQARDTSPHVLKILQDHGVDGSVTQWYEGSVRKLASLLRVTDSTNPTHYVRRTLTPALGLPLTTAEREADDAQGSLGFYFHENKDKKGERSDRVFGVSCDHVLRANTKVDYEFAGLRSGAPPQYVRVCGYRRFQETLAETNDLIAKNLGDAVDLATDIAQLETQERSADEEQAEDDERALKRKRTELEKLKEDNIILEKHLKDVTTNWSNIAARNIGHVDYAPKIAVDIDDRSYTRDFGTFELDPTKFKPNFIGNVVDLGSKWTSNELNVMFWSNISNRTGLKFPSNRLLKIREALTPELLATPNCLDHNGDPLYIVGKDGNTTGLTTGRYSALEAYLCDELGVESMEVAVYNFSKRSGNFSDHGDSGSLIWTGDGRMVAILHSGMPKGMSSHVTYGTPAWWVIKQLRLQYPHASFDRTNFSSA